MPGNDNYVVHLTMTDINSQNQNTGILDVNKTGDSNFQYYRIFKADDNGKTFMFSPMIPERGRYILQYKDNISQSAKVEIFSAFQHAAYPPFYDEPVHLPEMEPDSAFQINFDEGAAELLLETAGLYRIRLDDESVNGALLYHFFQGFPYFDDENHKLYPLRYLTSNEEFIKLISHPDPADAVDIFWTTMAGTYERGTKTVDRFYNNVKNANKLFATWKEGWKTDRGMIYSVFGPPDRVAKNDESETWTYYGTWRIPHTEFVFSKTETPIGVNCFELERHPHYKSPWFQVIENIRR